jgi:extradiol dioxygenase family protein
MSKRFHVHVHVSDLAQSVGFYSKLFGAAPARLEADYAKWMLEDPRVNFAISTRGSQVGVDHLGLQTDDAGELAAMRAQAQAADLSMAVEGETTCCYARSDKHWITDPQGIAWEHFHTMADVATFGAPAVKPSAQPKACCPARAANPQAACC